MAITFKELSEIAQIHYQKLPAPFKAKASEFFDALDADGDGLLTLPELLESGLVMKFSKDFVRHVFFSLDEEGKGHLEFPECMTLYYICMYSNRTCNSCSRAILQGLGYTCFRCHNEGLPTFTLCLDCFASRSFEHEHGHVHLLHDFVLFDNLLQSKPSSPPRPAPVKPDEQTIKQCIVCGDFHESGTRGFMCDVHMSKMRASNDSVCEWCFSYFCSKCGNLFRDSSTRAEPGKWLQRFVCPSCHQNQVSSDCYETSLQRLQSLLSTAELLQHCKTCEIKQRNGTLFWIVNGSNTASMSSTGNPPISRSSSEQINAYSAGSGPPASANQAAGGVARVPSANSYFPRNSHHLPGQKNPSVIQEVASTLRAFNRAVGLVDRAANVIGGAFGGDSAGGVDGGGGIDIFSAGGGADVLSAVAPLSDSSSWDA